MRRLATTIRKNSSLPIGVRQLPSGKYQARFQRRTLGTFKSAAAAHQTYVARRDNEEARV